MFSKYNLRTKTGVILILISIVLFLVLPLIPLLSIDGDIKLTIGTIVFILAEVLFYTGGFLVGKELFHKYKNYMNPKNWFKKNTIANSRMNINIEFRKIENKFINDILRIENDSDTSKYIIPYSAEKHITEMENPDNIYLGIFYNDQLKGFIILGIENEGKKIEFRRIVIGEKGNGFGQNAIQKLDKYCKEKFGTNRIWLDVFDFNQRGIHIYEKLGYRKKSETTFEGKKLLIMEKEI